MNNETNKIKILIIGAGIGQIPLCTMAKRRGYYIIVVTIQGNYPCIPLADKVYYQDVFDKDGVLNIAIMENVNAVISDQNDLMMPTVAYVAEHMHLPGNTTIQVESYSNKNIFCDICDILGIPVPKHIKLCSEQVPEHFIDSKFPLVVKPEDSQSSIGVAKVENKAQFTSALHEALSLSKNHVAIAEEFVDGHEIVCEGFIQDGKYYNLGFADRKYFCLDKLFIPSQTIFPSTISNEIRNQIIDYEKRFASYVQPSFAIVHSEYIVNEEQGKVWIIESAVRGGGVYISSHLIPLYTGIDINGVLLDCANGKKPDNISSIIDSKLDKASAYICFYLPHGTVCSISGVKEIKQLPYVHKCDIDINIGEQTKQIKVKGQRLGPIVIQGDNREDIERKINIIQSTLKIGVCDEQGDINGIKWE